jgi:hypothetical protein
MSGAGWSDCAGEVCVRFTGVTAGADVCVRPAGAVAVTAAPAMAGRLVVDGGDVCFVPRFGFVPGTTYTATVDGAQVARLLRPRPAVRATAGVIAIHPTAAVVPRNLLRCYVTFSAPMTEGDAAAHVRLVDDAGDVLPHALLPVEYELWDAGRRRLTVLLDPARIKRGLAGHVESGYPLRTGTTFRLVVDAAFRDAQGAPLRGPAERRYEVGEDLRGRVRPSDWGLTAPAAGGADPLVVEFGRPLDHALLRRCLRVIGPDGARVGGTAGTGPGDLSWRLTPDRPWAPGEHVLDVDPILEDVAGNSVTRVFDRDLDVDDQPEGPVQVVFHTR